MSNQTPEQRIADLERTVALLPHWATCGGCRVSLMISLVGIAAAIGALLGATAP